MEEVETKKKNCHMHNVLDKHLPGGSFQWLIIKSLTIPHEGVASPHQQLSKQCYLLAAFFVTTTSPKAIFACKPSGEN